jgi:hypothetical protein
VIQAADLEPCTTRDAGMDRDDQRAATHSPVRCRWDLGNALRSKWQHDGHNCDPFLVV